MRKRGLKDDTTCVVVDIVPPYNNRPLPSPRPPKKYDILKALLFRKKYTRSANKLAKRLSAVGIVEELFEEGSAMLAERFVFSFTLYSTYANLFLVEVRNFHNYLTRPFREFLYCS